MGFAEFENDMPFVSVVMPVYNEEKYICACLQSLTASEYPADRIEFIIVDGNSTDRTAELVFEMASRDPRIRLLSNPNKTVPYAMNIAIRAARGEYIVRVDAHAEYPLDYVRESVETLERTGAANAGGIWITCPGSKKPFGRAISYALTHLFGVGNASYRLKNREGFVDTVPFGAFRRSVFEKVGLYQEALTRHQDYELNCRIRKGGGGIYLNPKIQCRYFSRPSFKALWRQKFMDGKWNAYSWKVCPESMAFRHFIPSVFAGLAAILALGAAFSSVFQVAFLAGTAFYLLCAAAASISLFKRERDWAAFLCPLVFPILHFGHGFGLLYGLATMNGWVNKSWRYKEAPMLEPIPTRIVVREAA